MNCTGLEQIEMCWGRMEMEKISASRPERRMLSWNIQTYRPWPILGR